MIYDKILDAMGLPFTVIYGLMLLGFAYFIFVSIPKALKVKSWPRTPGKVKVIELHESKRTTKGGSPITVYSADIEYTYMVDGKEYSSKKIKWVDHRSNNKHHHEEVVSKYSVGREVSVFYNPKKPSIALLEPGFGTGNFILLIFFILGLGSMTLALLSKL